MANEEAKRQIHENIARIKTQFYNALQPHYELLARFEALEPPRPMIFHKNFPPLL